jgi:hypothetical protein
MANDSLECELPNGDVLAARYDGERLIVQVGTAADRLVFDRRFTHLDLTGDPVFVKDLPEEPSDTQPRGGRVATGVHFGPDE